MSKRMTRVRLQLKEEALSAAIHLAEKEGWSSVSIRRVAEAIEYSTTKIYDLFENKEQMVLELLRKGFAMLAEQMEQALQSSTNRHEQIVALTNAYCRFAWNNGAYYRIMYGMDGVPFGVQETWQEGMKIGEITFKMLKLLRPDEGEELLNQRVYVLWSILHGICSIFLARRFYGDQEQAEQLAKHAVLTYLHEPRSED